MKKFSLLLLLITVFVADLYAQETIFTDRPNVTDAVGVIAPGTFQVEAGFLYSSDNYYDTPNLSLKYGLTDFLEVRVLTTHKIYDPQLDGTGSGNISGLTPLTVSPKLKLTEQNGWIPKSAIVNSFVFPNTGSQEFDIPEFQAGITGLFEYTWGNITWTNSFGKTYTVENSGMLLTTVLGTGFTDQLGGFIEFYGNVGAQFKNSYNLDAGLTYIINNNLQIDVIYGHGITYDDFYFIGAGAAWKTNLK